MPSKASLLFFKLSDFMRKVGKNISKADRDWYSMLARWRKEDQLKDLRTQYDHIHPESIVIDLGGYEGQWASDIFARYLCSVQVFEPHPLYFEKIKKRFQQNDQIKIYNFGLGSKDEAIRISTAGDASTRYGTTEGTHQSVDAHLKNAVSFFSTKHWSTIDLMKINIEGGEYDLFDHLIAENWVENIHSIQVQFHDFVDHAKDRMTKIKMELSRTHELTYEYPFLWENWQRKTS